MPIALFKFWLKSVVAGLQKSDKLRYKHVATWKGKNDSQAKQKKTPTSFAGTIAKTTLDNGGNGGVGVSFADVSQKIKNANICLMKHQTKVDTT